MQKEHFVLLAMWLIGFCILFLFIPRQNRREGILASIMFQAIIWLCDIPSFYFEVFSAPVREFPKASALPITIDYFFYPILFSFYYVHQRNSARFSWKTFFAWVFIVTVIDILIERYTELLQYEIITWYLVPVYIGLLFFVSQICCNWFYHYKGMSQAYGG